MGFRVFHEEGGDHRVLGKSKTDAVDNGAIRWQDDRCRSESLCFEMVCEHEQPEYGRGADNLKDE